MNIFTHLGISVNIITAVEEEFHININRKGFMFGSIKPDISSKMNRLPHKKETVEERVADEIKNLLASGVDLTRGCGLEFSERLGIVTHYLSDFFCHAHSSHFAGDEMEHFRYEIRLSAYCRRNPDAIGKFLSGPYEEFGRDHASILTAIDKLHDEYLENGSNPSPERDMRFAIKASVSFCLSVISACVCGYEEAA